MGFLCLAQIAASCPRRQVANPFASFAAPRNFLRSSSNTLSRVHPALVRCRPYQSNSRDQNWLCRSSAIRHATRRISARCHRAEAPPKHCLRAKATCCSGDHRSALPTLVAHIACSVTQISHNAAAFDTSNLLPPYEGTGLLCATGPMRWGDLKFL